MHATCHVVSGGDAAGLMLERGNGDYVIAADAGYAACRAACVAPDLLVGDFDSLPGDVPTDACCETVTLPCAKDDTDTLAALRLGLERSFRHFIVHCALGGDVGHELANIHCLCFLLEHNAFGELRGKGQRVVLLDAAHSPFALNAAPGTRCSVFAFGGAATGVVERGVRWELDAATLRPGEAVGCSNEVTSDNAEVGVASGMLLVVVG